MSGVQDQLEIKFRQTDGSDIGPKSFPASASVLNLKESIIAQWPKERENGPRTVKDVKLISAGRILENRTEQWENAGATWVTFLEELQPCMSPTS